jgi:hypothetical protein
MIKPNVGIPVGPEIKLIRNQNNNKNVICNLLNKILIKIKKKKIIAKIPKADIKLIKPPP